MKNLNRKKLSGFTLIELLVVMAIFTILLVGTIAFIGPVQKIFSNTNESEKSHSYADTAKKYIEDSLEYADGLRIYQELPTSKTVSDLVKEYFDDTYKDIVKYNGSKLEYLSGTIRVLQLQNSNGGRISLSTYGFTGNNVDTTHSSTISALNENYFVKPNGNTNYILKYAIGVNTLENETDSSGHNFRVLSNDKGNLQMTNSPSLTDPGAISKTRCSLSVLATRHEEATKAKNAAGIEYTRFDEKSQLVTANIPLMNINNQFGNVSDRYKLVGTYSDLDAATAAANASSWSSVITANGTSPVTVFDFKGVNDATDPNADFQNLDNDIYFIYSYGDEIKK